MLKKTEEYYNAIRTNIQFSGAQIKVIAISSVEAGEGKSTTSVNLAISFASVGLRTLLIDADTRNSVLSGTFKSNEPYKGLSNFLSGNADLNETICQTNISGLDVIASGPVPPNPTSLLQNDNFRHLIRKLLVVVMIMSSSIHHQLVWLLMQLLLPIRLMLVFWLQQLGNLNVVS